MTAAQKTPNGDIGSATLNKNIIGDIDDEESTDHRTRCSGDQKIRVGAVDGVRQAQLLTVGATEDIETLLLLDMDER